jgi:hypothetical protein
MTWSIEDLQIGIDIVAANRIVPSLRRPIKMLAAA